jgi:hypothetical protein
LPQVGESELAFTRRCLSGQVRSAIDALGIRGLVVAGAGANPIRPVALYGQRFYPDLALFYYRSRVTAVEVKYLGRSQRENAVTTALGQAYVYQCGGYPLTAALLIDLAGGMTDADVRHAEKVCRSAGIEIVVRRRSGHLLAQHPS